MADFADDGTKQRNAGVDAYRPLIYDFLKLLLSSSITINSGSATALVAFIAATTNANATHGIDVHNLGWVLIGFSFGITLSMIGMCLSFFGSSAYTTAAGAVALTPDKLGIEETPSSHKTKEKGFCYFECAITLAMSSVIAFVVTIISFAVKIL